MHAEFDAKWGSKSFAHDPALLAGFQPRPTDVLITTAPKAGTTWMQQILYQMHSGGDDQFEVIYDHVPWLEFPLTRKTTEEILAGYEARTSPRIFKTHLTYAQTPGVDRVRCVMTSRDPRDCCVSMYHHKMDFTDSARAATALPPKPASFDAHVKHWIRSAAWYRNVESWWPHRNDDKVLWLRFEDLKTDLPGAIDRIASFLSWTLSTEARAKTIELASFGWMKDNAHRFTRFYADEAPNFVDGGFIRQGEVGKHAELSAEQADRILAEARRRLEPECLDFLGLG